MQQQYYITVPWNLKIRNASTDNDGLVTLCQLLDGALPTNTNRFQNGCYLSVLDGATKGVYVNSGTPQSPIWERLTSEFRVVRTTVTAAEIAQLETSPVSLTPTFGPNTYIVPLRTSVKWNAITPYTIPGIVRIAYGNFGIFAPNIAGPSFFTTTDLTPTTLLENTPVVLEAQGGNPFGGDGTLEIFVSYQVYYL